MLETDLPQLIDERRFRRREPEPFERDEHGRVRFFLVKCKCGETAFVANLIQRKFPEEKIPIDLEPIVGFNLRARVVGKDGENVKWIQGSTGCRVQIKGRGSGFKERDTQQESDEPMYLHVS